MLSQLTSLLGLTQVPQTPDARKGDRPEIDFASVFDQAEEEKRAAHEDPEALAGAEDLDPTATGEEDDADPVAVLGTADDDLVRSALAEDGEPKGADLKATGAAEFGDAFPETELDKLSVLPWNGLASVTSHDGEERVPARSGGAGDGRVATPVHTAGGEPPDSRAQPALSVELLQQQTAFSVSSNGMASRAIDAPAAPQALDSALSATARLDRTNGGQISLAGSAFANKPGAEMAKTWVEGGPASISGPKRQPGRHGDAGTAVVPDMPIFRLGHLSEATTRPHPGRKDIWAAPEITTSARMAPATSDTLQPTLRTDAAIGPDAASSRHRNAFDGFEGPGSQRSGTRASSISATVAGRSPHMASPHSASPPMMPNDGRINGAVHEPTLPTLQTGSPGLTSSSEDSARNRIPNAFPDPDLSQPRPRFADPARMQTGPQVEKAGPFGSPEGVAITTSAVAGKSGDVKAPQAPQAPLPEKPPEPVRQEGQPPLDTTRGVVKVSGPEAAVAAGGDPHSGDVRHRGEPRDRSSPPQRSEGTGAASGISAGPGSPISRAASLPVGPGFIAAEAALMNGTARVTSPLLADLLDDPVGADLHGAGHSSEARLMSAPGMTAPAAAPRADATATMRQVAEGMARLADGSVDIRLSPDELGHVRMQLAPSETGLTVHIMADRPETLDLLRRHIDQLARDLAEAGYDGASFTFGDGDGQDGRQPAAHQGAVATAAPDDQPAPGSRAEMPASDGLDLRM